MNGIKKAAVICVLKNNDRFLLLKRNKEPNKDNYTPVGGKIDPFENPFNAAKREIFEETGLKVEDLEYCGTLVETSPVEYNWICFVYRAEIDLISPPPCNEGKLEWIEFSDVLNVPTPKTDWFIYKYMLEGKKFNFSAEYDKDLEMLSMQDDLTNELLYNNSK